MRAVNANTGKILTQNVGIAAIALLPMSLLLHHYSVSSAFSEFTTQQLNSISAHVFFIVSLQAIFFFVLGIFISKLKFFAPGKIVTIAFIFGIILTINTHSLFLFHVDSLSSKPRLIKAIVSIITLFIAYSLGAAITHSRHFGLGITAICFVFSLFLSIFFRDSLPVDTSNARPVSGESLDGARNIYFISFDSMIPRSLAQKFLQTSDVPYMDVLEENEARIFKNGFSNFVPTKSAMNSMLALDPELYLNLEPEKRYLFFPGQAESTIYRTMHERGYKFQTMYDSPYLGARPGPFTDYYEVSRNQTKACKHIATDRGFLGFCIKEILALSTRYLELVGTQLEEPRRPYPEFLFDRIEQTAREEQHWFTMAHIYFPGHTEKNYRYDNKKHLKEYQEFFSEKSKIAAQHLTTLLNTIKNHDPDAIIMTYGDHGAWLSRGVAVQSNTSFPAEKKFQKFYVEDRHGINIAVWPGYICENEFKKIEAQNFAISTQVARAVIACATLGTDPLQNEPIFRLPLTKLAVEDRPSFKEYIYE